MLAIFARPLLVPSRRPRDRVGPSRVVPRRVRSRPFACRSCAPPPPAPSVITITRLKNKEQRTKDAARKREGRTKGNGKHTQARGAHEGTRGRHTRFRRGTRARERLGSGGHAGTQERSEARTAALGAHSQARLIRSHSSGGASRPVSHHGSRRVAAAVRPRLAVAPLG